MNEFPWRCPNCKHEQMVDMDRLESWPLDNLTSARGYTCEKCRSRRPISYFTTSLREAFQRLEQMEPTHRKFSYYFAKAVRKAEGINKRSKHGTRGHNHLATP